MRPRTYLVGIWVLVLGLLASLAACGRQEPAAAPSESAAPVISEPSRPPTPATSPAPTVTPPPPPAATPTQPSVTRSVAPQAEGSGCTPGTDDLPDGEWYGDAVAARAAAVDFDLACWFTGQAAIDAAAEDGAESPPPNDYYVRNTNPKVRTIAVDPDTRVEWYPDGGDPAAAETVPYGDWIDLRHQTNRLYVWLTVEDGAVVAVREQWIP